MVTIIIGVERANGASLDHSVPVQEAIPIIDEMRLRHLVVGFGLVFHLRERKRPQSCGGVILHDVAKNISGCAKLSADVCDAENEDEVEQPRHGVRAHAGFRGREETDPSPQ